MNKTYFGDCRESMKQMIAEGLKVQMCVTSPPYWGLRDYGVEGQIGLEKTPEEYVNSIVEVFSLVRDLLEDDGILWLNLGDSYASDAKSAGRNDTKTMYGENSQHLSKHLNIKIHHGLKPKDLVGIPWRVAFALQADGWYLRQDIIWHKPNPMPESVTDRCTKAHEYIFLLSKQAKYYYDADAIKEPTVTCDESYRNRDITRLNNTPGRTKMGGLKVNNYDNRNKRSVWTVPTTPYSEAHFATFPPALIEPCILAGSKTGDIVLDPFFGSGTTGEVCERFGRQWIGCELNKEYEPLQKDRTAQTGLRL